MKQFRWLLRSFEGVSIVWRLWGRFDLLAPHDVCLIVVGQDIHLRYHQVGDEVILGESSGVWFFETCVWVRGDDSWPTCASWISGLGESVWTEKRVELYMSTMISFTKQEVKLTHSGRLK